MCSIESIHQQKSHSKIKKYSNRSISLKLIDKRLNHLRVELQNLTRKQLTINEHGFNDEANDDYHQQYQKRFEQLLQLYEKQMKNLNLWHFYQSDRIEKKYSHELRQSEENFQSKKIDFKSKLLSSLNDKRRYLEYEHQNINIRHRQTSEHDQFLPNGMTNHLTDSNLYDAQNDLNLAQQRPTYNLRRAAANDLVAETPITSLKDLSIFSGSNSLLPPFGGIELQRCLANSDIEQDIKDVRRGLKKSELFVEQKCLTEEKSMIDVRIEDGRLWYQRAWFSRNSPILLVFDDLEIVPALVLTVGRNDLLVRRSGTNIKHRVSLSLLHDGHLAIRKRGCAF